MQSAAPPAPPQASDSCPTTRGGVDGDFSVYVGNLDPDTSLQDFEELLYELFLQAGPLSKVYIPFNNSTDKHKGYGFVEFQHVESVPYCLRLMAGIRLCGRVLNLGPVGPDFRSSATASSSSSSTTATTSTVTVDGVKNPFKSALETRVAQKEAELVTANPFLSSLNSHRGMPPLPPSTFTLPLLPPPPPLPTRPPPCHPPPFFPLSTPPLIQRSPFPLATPQLPPLLPPPTPPTLPPPPLPPIPPFLPPPPLPHPHTMPPLFPTNPTSSTVAGSNGPLLMSLVPLFGVAPRPTEKPKSESSGVLSGQQSLPPVQLFRMAPPPTEEPKSESPGVLSGQQSLPPKQLFGMAPPSTEERKSESPGMLSGQQSLPPKQLFGMAPPPTEERKSESPGMLSGQQSLPPVPLFGMASHPTEEQKSESPGMLSGEQSLPPVPLFRMAPPPTEERKSESPGRLSGQQSLPPVPLFGMAPPPTEERKSESPGMFSLERTVSDMVSNRMDHNGTPPPIPAVRSDEFAESEMETSKQQLMDTCPMSLQLCLNGEGGLSPHPTDVPQDDQNSYQSDHSQYQSSPFRMRDELPQDGTFSDGPSYPPPDVPIDDHSGPLITGPLATKLHRSRLSANDHPAWMTQQVRENIRNHHLSELQDTISRLKEAMLHSTSSPTP